MGILYRHGAVGVVALAKEATMTTRKRPPHVSRKEWATIKLSAKGHRVHGVLLEPAPSTQTQKSFATQWRVSQRNQARINQSYEDHPGPYAGHGQYIELSPAALAHQQAEQARHMAEYEAATRRRDGDLNQ